MSATDVKTNRRPSLERWIVIGFLILLPTSGYLLAFSDGSIFYMINVFLHVGLGLLLFIPAIQYGRRFLAKDLRTGKEIALYTGHPGFWCLIAGMSLGIYLAMAGNTAERSPILVLHIVLCLLGVSLLTTAIRRVGHQISIDNPFNTAGRWLLISIVTSVCLPLLVHSYRVLLLPGGAIIQNPYSALPSMEAEAMGGAQGPFFPTRARTSSQNKIDASFLAASETCGAAGCHPDIYRQWANSSHRASGWENLWYRKAVTEAEAGGGEAAANWCAGCHSPASLLAGKAAASINGQTETSGAHAGVSCLACHAVSHVQMTTGQADYVMAKPPLLDLATSENPWLRNLYRLFIRLDPQPHREAVLQSFHRKQTGAFCSSCHKGHTDRPLNGAHWLKVMNDYDSWRASSFGEGSLDFSDPGKKKNCASCHMPLVPSQDAGAQNGKVHDHRFLAANTSLLQLADNAEQWQAKLDFLRDNRITLDIFAASPTPTLRPPVRFSNSPEPDTTQSAVEKIRTASAVLNEETTPGYLLFPGLDSLMAPLEAETVGFRRGEALRLQVVVRSRDLGHHFPAGASDMAEAWLELQAVDDRGRVIFQSGALDDKEKIDPGAHVYGTMLVDSTGQRIHHPESWAARGAAFVNLLPPNSSDVVHYRLEIPPDCGDEIRVTAKLNYRKPVPTQWQRLADSSAQTASGNGLQFQKPTPRAHAIPIVELAHAEMILRLGLNSAHAQKRTVSDSNRVAERWNHYGEGLLRQHDLAGAERAFLRARMLAPANNDYLINTGIVWLRTNRVEPAQKVFQQALERSENPARAFFYLAMTFKAEGDYSKALSTIKKAVDLNRRDRTFRIELARLYHLTGDYRRAIRAFKKALQFDPEDPMVYYEMMQTYLAEGKPKSAARVERLYNRFRKDEAMTVLEQEARKLNDVLEAPSHIYHEHYSAKLPGGPEAISEATNGQHLLKLKP